MMAAPATPRAVASMSHLFLLGDSIFDNGSYPGGIPDVITHVRQYLRAGWKATLLAADGATSRGIDAQLVRLPAGASHLVMSAGGNDAIIRVATEHALPVLDLRQICAAAEDYANPIEPSSVGGAKIARAIVHAATQPGVKRRGAQITGAIH